MPAEHTGDPDLAAITRAASREAGGVPPELLGSYLPAVLDAARTGRRLAAAELAACGRSGEQAAEDGVALRGLVDLYLSATWRLWRELRERRDPASLHDAGLAVLRAADDAVAATAGGFEHAHLGVARRQEAERIEFVDDLLAGRGGMADLVTRGARFGLRLAGPHQVLVAAGSGVAGRGGSGSARLPVPAADQLVARAAGAAPSLLVARGGRLVAVVGGAGEEAALAGSALAAGLSESYRDGGNNGDAGRGDAGDLGTARGGQPLAGWRVAVGRPHLGPSGVLQSYDEAVDALDVADRLGLPDRLVLAADLLVYRVLLRDRAAMADLVGAVLVPLQAARGGAKPLLDTLEAYFASGGVAARTARRMHLSVRAVTYRLARVRQLTGRDPADPAAALALQVAVIGAQLLGWPATSLSEEQGQGTTMTGH
ncbi:MAG TPA: helix-turn-helix domain-containing protein [Streptosporangiaceae bacterium]